MVPMSADPPTPEGFVPFRGYRTWYRVVGDGEAAVAAPYPRIELHVHLEATVRPARLLEIARRNDVRLPAKTAAGLARFCRFKDFDHFIRVWIKTTQALRRECDFHQVVVDYAADLAAQGCVYAEALFSPSEPMGRGTPWQESFEGYCGGADEAREVHGVDIRFTPDITRDFPVEIAEQLVDWAVKYRERGVVGVSLGGSEHSTRPSCLRGRSRAPARAASRPRRTPVKSPGPPPCAAPSTCCTPTACGTACAPPKTLRCSPRSPPAASSAT